jgi:trk system potassium uptake protein TrkA
MYVIIVGAGKLGYHLAKNLLAESHEILLVEKDKGRYNELIGEFGENIVWGDGAEARILKEIGVNRADVLVAVTGDDEDNLVICQMAKIMYMIPRTIAKVNDPKHEEIFTSLGIDATVSSTRVINNIISQEVDAGSLLPLLALKGGKIEIIETELSSDSALVDKAIADVKLPDECIIISVIRGEDVIVPKGNTILKSSDTIIALASKEKEAELKKLL